MKISTQTRYALRFLLELAVHELNPNNSAIKMTTQEIASSQQISEKYLESIASKLRKNGFINSIKGVNGGYWLAKSPDSITLGDIMRVMENEYFVVHCINDPQKRCPNFEGCQMEKFLRRIESKIDEVVDHVTLESIYKDRVWE